MTDSATSQRFGIVGATTPDLPTVSSPRDVIITSSDITETAQVVQQEIDRLYDEYGVRKLIFVSHLQNIDNDQEIIAHLSKVDLAVAGGGDELLVNPAVDRELQLLPGEQAGIDGTYPLEVADADGRTVYIVTTAGNYKYLGRLDVAFDADGEVSGFNETSSYPRRVIPTSDAADMLAVDDTVVMDASLVTSVNEPVAACLDELANTPIVRSEILLDVSRSGVRGSESNAGNLIADSFLYVYEQYSDTMGLRGSEVPVIAVQNGGGIRQNAGDILPTGGAPGTLSQLDTLNVLPFDNFITVIEQVSPADMKDIFERSGDRLPGAGGQFLQVAGFHVTYNISNSAGSRVVELMLEDGTAIIQHGEVVDGAPNVSIVTNSFIARGGDGYSWLGDNPNQSRLFDEQGNAVAYEQAWREYLQSFPFDSGLPTVQEDDPRYQPGGEGRITFLFDGDNDGVDNQTEDGVPNPDGSGTGDGNGDNTPDSEQANVVSLPNANAEGDPDAGDVTLESPASTTFVDVTATLPISLPESVKAFPQGQFSFIIDGVTADETVSITMSLHNVTNIPDSYWKEESAGNWFEFDYDDVTETGAISGTNDFGQTTFTLYLRDGERGDNETTTS